MGLDALDRDAAYAECSSCVFSFHSLAGCTVAGAGSDDRQSVDGDAALANRADEHRVEIQLLDFW